jgi:hypothetical protein
LARSKRNTDPTCALCRALTTISLKLIKMKTISSCVFSYPHPLSSANLHQVIGMCVCVEKKRRDDWICDWPNFIRVRTNANRDMVFDRKNDKWNKTDGTSVRKWNDDGKLVSGKSEFVC